MAGKPELPFAKYCEDLRFHFALPADVKTGPFKIWIKKLQRKKVFSCPRRAQREDRLTRTQDDSGPYPASTAAQLQTNPPGGCSRCLLTTAKSVHGSLPPSSIQIPKASLKETYFYFFKNGLTYQSTIYCCFKKKKRVG